MDWTNAKNKLIILFLSINILLGWANYRKVTSAYVLKESQIEDITNVLRQNNIFIDAPMPKKYKPLPKITVFPFQIDSNIREDYVKKFLGTLDDVKVSIKASDGTDSNPQRIYSKDGEDVIFEGEKIYYHNKDILEKDGDLDKLSFDEAKKLANKCLIQLGYSPKKMHIQLDSSSDNLRLNYFDKYKGIPVFDSYIGVTITSGGISEVEIHKVELGEVAGDRKEIYPIDQVFFYLIKLISTDEPVYIEDITIGYGLENPKGAHLIAEKALPFYQITLKGGETYHINAYNSEIREEARK